jgi:hypothetical protein
LKTLQFGQKSTCEVVAYEGVGPKKISTLRKKPSNLHQDNKKDCLRASLDWPDSIHGGLEGIEMYTYLKDFALSRECLGILFTQSSPGNYFPGIVFLCSAI